MAEASALNTDTYIEKVAYSPPPPRSSLDFAIHMADGSELGDAYLRLESFQGGTQVSQPFHYDLELRANDLRSDSVNPTKKILTLEKIMGRPATISLDLPKIVSVSSSKKSYINGIVNSFSMVDAGVYKASLSPALFKLTLANDYRLYSSMTIKQVLEAVVKDKHQIECDLSGVQGLADSRKQDWLQAGETDFEFISRLMGKVSIYYYFIHEFGKHTAVFANKAKYHQLYERDPSSNQTSEPLSLYYTYSKVASLEQDCLINSFSYKQDLTTSRVKSLISEPHAAWEKDETATTSNYESDVLDTIDQPISDSDMFFQYQVFQYGANKAEAEDFAKSSLNKLVTSASEISGQCTTPELKPGYLFNSKQHKSKSDGENSASSSIAALEMRPEFDDKPWVVTSVNESAQASGTYQSSFVATSADGQIAPFGLTNTHMGSMLAIVTSAPDDKAQNAKYLHYLEKNNFSYDTNRFDSSFDGQYLCKGVYVKFYTDGPSAKAVWVKLAESMQTIPEVGVTVIVSRSQDESEIPEIQSIIQSKGNKVINPNGATDSTNVGDNYSTSYGDSHSIRYGKSSSVDLANARSIITNEYKTGTFKDVSYSQGASYSYSISENGMSGTLSKSYSEGSTYSDFKGDETKSYSTIGTSYSESSITDLSESISNIQQSKNYSVLGGTETPDKAEGYSSYTSVSTNKVIGNSYSKSENTGDSVSDNTIDGQSKSTSTIGSSHNESTIKGGSYSWSKTATSNNINILGAGVNTSVTGAQNNTSLTGAQSSESLVGVTADISFAGMTNSMNTTGMANSASFVGMSNSSSMVANENSLKVALTSNSIEVLGGGVAYSDKLAVVDARTNGIEVKLGTIFSEIVTNKSTL